MHDLKLTLKKIKVNIYFIIFFAFCLIIGSFKEMGLLFLFLALHEISHGILALAFKLNIENIEFFPFGGVARIDGLDSAEPIKQIMISAAGPLFNIAAGLIAYFALCRGFNSPDLTYIIRINAQLAIFNLIPGLPLDGGRILRAFLSEIVGFRKATRAAVLSGKIISVIIFLCGIVLSLYGRVNLSFLVMPFFIFFSANREEEILMYTIMKSILNKEKEIKGKAILETRELCAYDEVRAREVLKYFDVNKYHVIEVINSSMEVEFILTEYQLIKALSSHEGNITLGEVCKIYK